MKAITSALPRILTALRGNLLVGLTLAVVTLPQALPSPPRWRVCHRISASMPPSGACCSPPC
jgi:hypothetical protein